MERKKKKIKISSPPEKKEKKTRIEKGRFLKVLDECIKEAHQDHQRLLIIRDEPPKTDADFDKLLYQRTMQTQRALLRQARAFAQFRRRVDDKNKDKPVQEITAEDVQMAWEMMTNGGVAKE